MTKVFLCPTCNKTTTSTHGYRRDYGYFRYRFCKYCMLKFATLDDGGGEKFLHWVEEYKQQTDFEEAPKPEDETEPEEREQDPLATWPDAHQMRRVLVVDILHRLKWFCSNGEKPRYVKLAAGFNFALDGNPHIVKRLDNEDRADFMKFAELIRQKRGSNAPLTVNDVINRGQLARVLFADDKLYKQVIAATEAEYRAYRAALDGGDSDKIIEAKNALIMAELAAARRIKGESKS